MSHMCGCCDKKKKKIVPIMWCDKLKAFRDCGRKLDHPETDRGCIPQALAGAHLINCNVDLIPIFQLSKWYSKMVCSFRCNNAQ